MGKADLHVHTTYSDGLPSLEAVLAFVQERTDLDVLAITDHDTLDGAWRARDIVAGGGFRFDLIVGAEITTRQGHLLALFLDKPVRSLRPVEETIAAVHEQGGICIAPHPFSWLTRSLGESVLNRIQAHRDAAIYLDGLETWNPSLAGRITRQRAIAWNVEHGLATTGSSDAHFLGHLGMAYSEFSGRTAADLRAAIVARQTVARRAAPRPEHRVGVDQLARQQVKSLLELPARRVSAFAHRRWSERRNAARRAPGSSG